MPSGWLLFHWSRRMFGAAGGSGQPGVVRFRSERRGTLVAGDHRPRESPCSSSSRSTRSGRGRTGPTHGARVILLGAALGGTFAARSTPRSGSCRYSDRPGERAPAGDRRSRCRRRPWAGDQSDHRDRQPLFERSANQGTGSLTGSAGRSASTVLIVARHHLWQFGGLPGLRRPGSKRTLSALGRKGTRRTFSAGSRRPAGGTTFSSRGSSRRRPARSSSSLACRCVALGCSELRRERPKTNWFLYTCRSWC